MDVAPGGMPGPRTCTLPFLNPTLIVVDSCRCWTNGFVSSLLHEPPYTEPFVRWCGRTAGATPPPTRLCEITASVLIEGMRSLPEMAGFASIRPKPTTQPATNGPRPPPDSCWCAKPYWTEVCSSVGG